MELVLRMGVYAVVIGLMTLVFMVLGLPPWLMIPVGGALVYAAGSWLESYRV